MSKIQYTVSTVYTPLPPPRLAGNFGSHHTHSQVKSLLILEKPSFPWSAVKGPYVMEHISWPVSGESAQSLLCSFTFQRKGTKQATRVISRQLLRLWNQWMTGKRWDLPLFRGNVPWGETFNPTSLWYTECTEEPHYERFGLLTPELSVCFYRGSCDPLSDNARCTEWHILSVLHSRTLCSVAGTDYVTTRTSVITCMSAHTYTDIISSPLNVTFSFSSQTPTWSYSLREVSSCVWTASSFTLPSCQHFRFFTPVEHLFCSYSKRTHSWS